MSLEQMLKEISHATRTVKTDENGIIAAIHSEARISRMEKRAPHTTLSDAP